MYFKHFFSKETKKNSYNLAYLSISLQRPRLVKKMIFGDIYGHVHESTMNIFFNSQLANLEMVYVNWQLLTF